MKNKELLTAEEIFTDMSHRLDALEAGITKQQELMTDFTLWMDQQMDINKNLLKYINDGK